MQPPNNNPAPPEPVVMGSVAQPQHQPYGQPQVQAQPQVMQFTQPQMIGQPVIMQQMTGGIVMGGGYPQTSAMAAMILSIVSFFITPFTICLAIPSLIMANNALSITNQIPGHPDAGTARVAQVISWLMIGLTLLFVFAIVSMIIAGVLFGL